MNRQADPLANKSVLVLGLGTSGRSAADFLLSRKAKVVGVDNNADLLQHNQDLQNMRLKGLQTFHDSAHLPIGSFDLVIVSPGIPQSHPLYKASVESGIETIGEIELACRYISQSCIGITGTNGKTTVTMLVAHVLNHSGIPAKALGNSGTPMTSLFADSRPIDPHLVIVAELSSYQLETMKSAVLDAAVLLNITPDHLDRYAGMEEYAKAKMQIIKCLKKGAPFYIEERCCQEFGHLFFGFPVLSYGYSPSCAVYTDKQRVFVKENIECFLPLQYRGMFSHDVENFLAAYALCKEFGVSPQKFLEGFSTFTKPSHRLEHVTDIGGVAFIDDSKGTNIDAVIRAVDTMKGEVILIAGGVDKGAAYTPWIKSFAGKVRCICAIGQAAPKIKQELEPSIPVELFQSLEEAVRYAAGVAKKGGTVLLSPGCSSFDMFRDYAHRGEEFKKIVEKFR